MSLPAVLVGRDGVSSLPLNATRPVAAHSFLSRDRAEAGNIVSRLSPENEALAREIIARYPRPKSAVIPLCHLVQEEHGHLTDDGMAHVAELVGVTAAQVQGTASFYEMFKRHETGRYVLGICTNISCLVLGGAELLARAEERLGIRAGSTTADGRVTLEDTECLAACTDAPMCQVNYRYFGQLSDADFDELLDDIASGAIDEVVPAHGTLALVRQHIPDDRVANIGPPEIQVAPQWFTRREADLAPTDVEGGA